MLVIKPDECIDCGVCEPECPLEAIISDTESESEKWLELNKNIRTYGQTLIEKKIHYRIMKNLVMKKISLKNILKKNL